MKELIKKYKTKLIIIAIFIGMIIGMIIRPYFDKMANTVIDAVSPTPIVYQAEDDTETKAIKEIMKRDKFQQDVMHYALWTRSMELEREHRNLAEKYGAIGTVEWGRLQGSMQDQLTLMVSSTTIK